MSWACLFLPSLWNENTLFLKKNNPKKQITAHQPHAAIVLIFPHCLFEDGTNSWNYINIVALLHRGRGTAAVIRASSESVSRPMLKVEMKHPHLLVGLKPVDSSAAQPLQNPRERIGANVPAIIVLLSNTRDKRQIRQLLTTTEECSSLTWLPLEMHREPSLSLDNKPPETTLPRGARRDLVCEKIKDLNKSGHILQAGGSSGGLLCCGCRKDNKRGGE